MKNAYIFIGVAIIGLLVSFIGYQYHIRGNPQNTPAEPHQATASNIKTDKPSVKPELKIIRELNIPGVTNYNGMGGDWNGDGKPDLFMIRDSKLIILSSDNKILGEYPVGNLGLNLLADIDNDKKDEIFLSSTEGENMNIVVYGQDMKELKRFTAKGCVYNGRPDSGMSAQKIIDLGKDGKRELLAQVGTGYGWKPRGIYCFNLEDCSLLWKYHTGPSAGLSDVIDLNNDGSLEIVFGTYPPGNGNKEIDGTDDMHSYLYAISAKGELIWVKQLADYFTGTNYITTNIKNDGSKEILAYIAAGPEYRTEAGKIVRLNAKGEFIKEFDAGSQIHSCVAEDLNGDGKKEVIATTRLGLIFVLDETLQMISKKQVETTDFEAIIMGIQKITDLNNDGKKEIVISYTERKFISGNNPRSDGGPKNIRHYFNNSLLILDSDLNILARHLVAEKWEQHKGISAIVADFNKDKKPEILLLSEKAILFELK
jgi:hypothetical protein